MKNIRECVREHRVDSSKPYSKFIMPNTMSMCCELKKSISSILGKNKLREREWSDAKSGRRRWIEIWLKLPSNRVDNPTDDREIHNKMIPISWFWCEVGLKSRRSSITLVFRWMISPREGKGWRCDLNQLGSTADGARRDERRF